MPRPCSAADPSAVLTLARDLYSGCRRYSDAGEVVTFSRSAPTLDFTLVRRSYFATDYVRESEDGSPCDFVFESRRTREDDATHWHRFMVWTEGGEPRSWTSHRPEAGGGKATLGELLSGAVDSTMGASRLAASMLAIEGVDRTSPFSEETEPADVRAEWIGSDEFTRLTIWNTDSSRTRMWLAPNGALHHLEETIWSLGSGPRGARGAPTVMRATTLKPSFDQASRTPRSSSGPSEVTELRQRWSGLFAGLKTDRPLRAPFSISEPGEAELPHQTKRRIELSVMAPSLKRLATAACSFCIWAERGRDPGCEELADRLPLGEPRLALQLLGALAAEASRLPSSLSDALSATPHPESRDVHAGTRAASEAIARRFEAGGFPPSSGGEPALSALPLALGVEGTDAQELASIWSDVRQGLDAWEAGDYDEALESWRWSYDHRWGSRSYRLLSGLHKRLHD